MLRERPTALAAPEINGEETGYGEVSGDHSPPDLPQSPDLPCSLRPVSELRALVRLTGPMRHPGGAPAAAVRGRGQAAVRLGGGSGGGAGAVAAPGPRAAA